MERAVVRFRGECSPGALNPREAAATPLAVSTEPPGDQGDARSSRPWLSAHDDSKATSSTADSPARKVRMVGAVSDPGLDGDGLGLTGPGAPGQTKAKSDDQHPVRARLMEKARAAEKPPEESSPVPSSTQAYVSRTPPVVDVGAARETSAIPFLDEPSPPPPIEKREAPSVPQDAPPISVSAPTPHPGAVASELDRIARRTAPLPQGPGLSPNMIAVIGGLLGLTVITTLGLFLARTEVKPTVAAPVETPNAAPKEAAPVPEVKREKREKIPGPWRIADDASKPGHRVLSGKIGKLAFLTAIQEAGLPKSEAYRAYGALKTELDLDHCKSGDSFQALVRGPERQLLAFEYTVTKEDVYQVKESKDGKLEASKLDLKVTRNQIRRSFVHDGKSFEESARRAGFDPGLSAIAEVALRGHSSMEDLRRGDRLRIIAQEVTVLGEFSRYAGLEAMEIVRAGEEPRRIYFYPHASEGGYFDINGKAPYEGGWRKPIPTAPRTSPFNPKRMHPTLKRVMPHNGTDFGCATGTPIGATSPGTISFRGQGGGYGNLIRIKHAGGYESGYAHLSRFENGLSVGDQVERMQTIGYCGSTGRSTGPHLHFEIKKDGVFIDAETLSLDGLRVLPKAHREEFASVRAKYDPILDEIPLPEPLPLDAAPAVAPATPTAEPSEAEEVEEESLGQETNGMVQDEAPATAARPVPPSSPGKAPPSDPAAPQAPSAIFLSDSDLLRMQSATDDGEVSD